MVKKTRSEMRIELSENRITALFFFKKKIIGAEFAYFQTTDSPSQPFGNLVPLSLYTDMCTAAFG